MKYLLLAVLFCVSVQAETVKEFEARQWVALMQLQASDARFKDGKIDGKQGKLFPIFQEYLTKNHDSLLKMAQNGVNPYALAREFILEGAGEKVPTYEQALAVVKLYTPGYLEMNEREKLKIKWTDGYWRAAESEDTPRTEAQSELIALRAENARLKEALSLVRDLTKNSR